MRILQVVHYLPPAHTAGVEVYTDRLARALRAEHEVAVLSTAIQRDAINHQLEVRTERGLPIYEIVQNRWFTSFEASYRDERMRAPISNVLDDFLPDVVHIHHLMGHSLVLLEELEHRKLPFIMTVHDHWFDCAAGGQRFHRRLGRCERFDAVRCGECMAHASTPAMLARATLERLWSAPVATTTRPDSGASPDNPTGSSHKEPWGSRSLAAASRALRVPTARMAKRVEQRRDRVLDTVRGAACLVAPSRFMAEELVRLGLPAERIRRIDHGFPSQSHASDHELPSLAARFGTLGSLVRHKGLHVALRAFDSMPTDATLEIAGWPGDDPNYVAELASLARHPGVRFLGRLGPAEVEAFLSHIDCLIVPSLWTENSPLVIREAHLAGIPVVASRLGGHIEILEEGGGLLYEPDSSKALALTLRRLAEEPGLLAKVAATAPRVVPLDEHVSEVSSLYAEVLATVR